MPTRFALIRPTGPRQTLGAGLCAIGMAVAVGGALAFQHVGGYLPCALCLEQRTPYYAATPVAALAFLLSRAAPALVVRLMLLFVAAAMLYAAWLGGFHAGVEQGWWAGPTDCAAAGGFDMSGDLLSQLDTVRAPSCEEPALLVFGLSLAVWNMVAAIVIAIVALRTALSGADRFAED